MYLFIISSLLRYFIVYYGLVVFALIETASSDDVPVENESIKMKVLSNVFIFV